jgi:tetratricopeptide (TPR) repeat protein
MYKNLAKTKEEGGKGLAFTNKIAGYLISVLINMGKYESGIYIWKQTRMKLREEANMNISSSGTYFDKLSLDANLLEDLAINFEYMKIVLKNPHEIQKSGKVDRRTRILYAIDVTDQCLADSLSNVYSKYVTDGKSKDGSLMNISYEYVHGVLEALETLNSSTTTEKQIHLPYFWTSLIEAYIRIGSYGKAISCLEKWTEMFALEEVNLKDAQKVFRNAIKMANVRGESEVVQSIRGILQVYDQSGRVLEGIKM